MSAIMTLKLLRSVRTGMMDINEKVNNIASQVRWTLFVSFLCTSGGDMLGENKVGSGMTLLKVLPDMNFVFAEAGAMPLDVDLEIVWFLHIACPYGPPAPQISMNFIHHEPATGGKDWWSSSFGL